MIEWDHRRALSWEGEGCFYKQGACDLSLDQRKNVGAKNCHSHLQERMGCMRPGGAPWRGGPEGLLYVEMGERRSPGRGNSLCKALEARDWSRFGIATAHSRSGLFPLNQHGSSARL